jgi:hypothetical protein
MRYKNITQSVVAALAIMLSGCGSSSSDSSSSSTSNYVEPIPTDVTVERGAVYDANVTDASGKVAVQKSAQNVYTFDDVPTYPIMVSGGWIDVDGDGKKTVEDVELPAPMYSYNNTVTPISTYIADSNETKRDQRLAELETELGISKDELLKLPSNASTQALVAQNAIYHQLVAMNNDTSMVTIEDIKAKFSDYNTTASQSSGSTSSELAIIIEKEVMDSLVLSEKISYVSLDDADMTESEKEDYVLSKNDFVIDNMISSFTSVSSAELSTEYVSNVFTISGIDVDLNITISNSDFTIVKNDIDQIGTSISVSDGDVIKLKTTSSDQYDTSKSTQLSIESKFTDVSYGTYNLAEAKSLCSSLELELPSVNELDIYYRSNQSLFDSSVTQYWTSTAHSLDGFGNTYNTTTKSSDSSLSSYSYGVICTKNYNTLTYSVTTKSDPNQAPIANAGSDMKVYYTETATFDASASSDDKGIVSYSWKEGTTLLSSESSFSKSDFIVGTHTVTLEVTDEGGKTSTDTVVVEIYDDFTDILPMDEVGGMKSVSSYSNGVTTTITLGAGSQLYFKITNDTDREYSVSEFKITHSYNGTVTTDASTSDTSLLSGGTLSPSENISLGYTLTSSTVANYWIGTYTLTDNATGEVFTNSLKWQGTTW